MDNKISRRIFFLLITKSILFGLIIYIFYYLQIISYNQYYSLSDKNRIRTKKLIPLRAQITDRDGQTLVTNKLIYITKVKKNSDLKHLADLFSKYFNIDLQFKELDINYYKIENYLTWDQIASIEDEINNDIEVIFEFERLYLYSEKIAHITGYISRDKNNNVLGKTGLELSMNTQLKGDEGFEKIEVDAHNKIIKIIDNKTPNISSDLQCTIDIKLQEKIWDLIHNYNGAFIVMSNNGEILSLHSKPSYNPNIFINQSNNWQNIFNQHRFSMNNKCISSCYPPGSIFKVTTMLGILKHQLHHESILCTGTIKIGKRIFHCWNKHGHGRVNITNALKKSCNIYFGVLGMQLGINNLSNIAIQLGLGHKTGIELPFEKSGLMPNSQWKFNKYHQPWTKGDTINASIGQGYILTTPIQLTQMMARVVLQKEIFPTLFVSDKKYNNLKLGDIQTLMDNMIQVVTTQKHLKVAGKTGTAQVISNRKARGLYADHALFCGYAPYDNPQYIITVIIENGGWGAETALPLALKIFNLIL